MFQNRLSSFLSQKFNFFFRVFILAKTWGTIRILLFIPYELYYIIRLNTYTLFSINNEELDLEKKDKLHLTEYFPTPYYILSKVFNLVKTDLVDSVFVDIGAGAGRSLTFVYNFKPKKIIGVELSKKLFSIAEDNMLKYFDEKKNVTWKLFNQNALDFNIPEDANVFFFYDPFDEHIMRKVIKKIKSSFKIKNRTILIIYISPRCRHLFTKNSFRLIHLDINNFNKGFAVFKYN